MYVLKVEYLEKRGSGLDAVFSGMTSTPLPDLALATMIEFVEMTEDTFKRCAEIS